LTLFVDTSAWYAAADSGDSHNSQAKEVLGAVEPLVTTDHVLVESWLLLHHRLSGDAAERFWGALRTGAATLEPVGLADLQAAWAIGRLFPDHDFSIVDRTSFAVMERLGIDRVATFDSDFAVYRFGRDRRRAFTVVGAAGRPHPPSRST
jgi:predicted nucleic acid-binding protein